MNTTETKRLDALTMRLHNLLRGDIPELVELTNQPNDEIRQLGEFLNRLITAMAEIDAAAKSLAEGDIHSEITSRHPVGQRLKGLQATLRHLAWQTNQVAQGDFSQQIDFLGDFSSSFNSMVSQLEANQKMLLEQAQELRRLAYSDPLTSLPNRRSFLSTLESELARWKRYGTSFCFGMLDLDHFKRINDNYGHDAGDVVLQTLSSRLQQSLRENDILGRLGGEEFGLLLPETEQSDAWVVAERTRHEAATNPVAYKAESISVTLSIGLAICRPEDQEIESLLKRADTALYEAKKRGRNCIVVSGTAPEGD